jgi:hypothetical protein
MFSLSRVQFVFVRSYISVLDQSILALKLASLLERASSEGDSTVCVVWGPTFTSLPAQIKLSPQGRADGGLKPLLPQENWSRRIDHAVSPFTLSNLGKRLFQSNTKQRRQ